MKSLGYLEAFETGLWYMDVYERTKNYFKDPGIFNKSLHRLRVGIPDDYYFDFDIIINDLSKMKDIVFLYKTVIEEIVQQRPIDFLGVIEKADGGTTGTLRLAGTISIETGIPNILIRLAKELPFEKIKISSRVGKSQKTNKVESLDVTLILDHCTTGSEAFKAVDAIEKNGGKVTDVVAYTARTDKLRLKEFNNKGITFHYLHDVSPEGLGKLGLTIED